MKKIIDFFKDLKHYPTAIVGLIIIGFLLAVSVYTIITIPYNEAVKLWNGADKVWIETPRFAKPEWFDWFTPKKLPKTLKLDSSEIKDSKVEETYSGEKDIDITLEFDYQFDDFPSELTLFFKSDKPDTTVFGTIYWETPDGRKIMLKSGQFRISEPYVISNDDKISEKLYLDVEPHVALFSDPDSDGKKVLKGKYKLKADLVVFDEEQTVDMRLVVYGKVYGIAGTDHLRRDIRIALLWGTPIALAFGLLAALITAMSTLIIASIGAWYGGAIDTLLQRITEVNMMLPFLPILIMVSLFISRSLWVILGFVILLSIFGSGAKVYRAMFLQVRESPYIEAAKAYGAGSGRIIFRYMIPRVIPTLIPGLITQVPSYVFLESSLAILGIGDPVIPTWGKILYDAQSKGALYMGHYYWVIIPAVLLMFTGYGFAMLGYALDRIFNPRLRRM